MVTWNVEITEKKGSQFPWHAAVVDKNGKRLEVGEFLEEKEARSYGSMEWHRLTAKEKPEPAAKSLPA